MYEVIIRIKEPDATIRLSIECDEICKECPHIIDGVCVFDGSVKKKDKAALEFLGLNENNVLTSNDLCALVEQRLSGLKDIQKVCGECEWSELCNKSLMLPAKI